MRLRLQARRQGLRSAWIAVESTARGLVKKTVVAQEPLSRVTWDSRASLNGVRELFERMRASGLPLASSGGEEAGDGDVSKITALVALNDGRVEAFVAAPSGLVFRFAPEVVEPHWWSFALRNYYIVTGNLADRLALAEVAEVDAILIKGKCISRLKGSSLSGMTLDQLLELACPTQQGALF